MTICTITLSVRRLIFTRECAQRLQTSSKYSTERDRSQKISRRKQSLAKLSSGGNDWGLRVMLMIQWTRGGWLESAESQRGALKLQLESPTTHEHLSHRREKLENYLQISTKTKWEKNQPPTAALQLLYPSQLHLFYKAKLIKMRKNANNDRQV